LEQKDLSVLKNGAPDIVRCTRPYSRWTSHSQEFQGVLRYNSPDCLVCHRTVRCTSGAMTLCANGRLCRDEQWMSKVWAQSEGTRLSGVALDCPVQQDDKDSNGRPASNPNGCADVARTGQCTMVVRCAHRQQPSPTAMEVVGGYKYPPTTSFITIQAFLNSHSLQEQSPTLQDTIKAINPLKAPKSTLVH
jgi:hypothetical protein